MIIKPLFYRNTRSPHKCLFILFLTVAWLYVIFGNLISNYENHQECYRIMK